MPARKSWLARRRCELVVRRHEETDYWVCSQVPEAGLSP